MMNYYSTTDPSSAITVYWGGVAYLALANIPGVGNYDTFTQYSFKALASSTSTVFQISAVSVSSSLIFDNISVKASATETTTGLLTFGDAELNDVHTIAASARAAGYVGSFQATMTDDFDRRRGRPHQLAVQRRQQPDPLARGGRDAAAGLCGFGHRRFWQCRPAGRHGHHHRDQRRAGADRRHRQDRRLYRRRSGYGGLDACCCGGGKQRGGLAAGRRTLCFQDCPQQQSRQPKSSVHHHHRQPRDRMPTRISSGSTSSRAKPSLLTSITPVGVLIPISY